MDHVRYTKDYDMSFVRSNCNYRVKFTVALCLNKETNKKRQTKIYEGKMIKSLNLLNVIFIHKEMTS